MATPTLDADVLIAGDGPAAGALCRACVSLGLDVVVVGHGAAWTNHYGTWLDDLDQCMSPEDRAATAPSVMPRLRVVGDASHVIARDYALFDNHRLREWTGIDRHLEIGEVRTVDERPDVAVARLASGRSLTARWVINATGPPVGARPAAWQTAYGVFVDDDEIDRVRAAIGIADDAPTATLMDWSPAVGAPDVGAPTFAYVVDVGGRWLVEETVLASANLIAPDALRSRLIARLAGVGEEIVTRAERAGDVDRVVIPMGLPAQRGKGRVATFGTAAGMGHPATGYSVAAALRAAPHLAEAIATGNDVRNAVWSPSARRVRALHDYGLAVMLTLDANDTRRFFDAFFELPVEVWAPYMRNDSDPRSIVQTMSSLFARLPWTMRRQLVAAAPSFSLGRARRVARRAGTGLNGVTGSELASS